MAFVALTSLMATLEVEFLQPTPRVSFNSNDNAAIKSLFDSLGSLEAFLHGANELGAAINDLETEIRDFALKVEDDIEMQLSNFLVAKGTEHEEEASQEFHQILREAANDTTELMKILSSRGDEADEAGEKASQELEDPLREEAENATELLKVIQKRKEHEEEREKTCEALTSLMSTIKFELLQPIQRVCLHDQAPIKSLNEMLSTMQAFLNEANNDHGVAIKDLETRIREFALGASEDIEIQVRNFQQKVPHELPKTLLGTAEKAAELLNITNIASNPGSEADGAKNGTQQSIGGVLIPHESECERKMVCRQHDFKVIMDELIRGPHETRLISIVGMAGIGKTTLARSVYEDPLVEGRFDLRCWITMPQEYNKSEILRNLLRAISLQVANKIKKGSAPEELAKQIRRCLHDRRYLIVFDNLLNSRAWDDIKQCLPTKNASSRILLTTSHFDRRYYSGSQFYIYNMTLLNPKESWDLFCDIHPFERRMAPKFEEIKDHIVKVCDGLPWSIVAVAKRLSKCNDILKKWKRIEKEIESLGILDPDDLTHNYNKLPQHLKVCFLYLAVFPKREEILVKNLIRLWIAEGFLKSLEQKELENQAYAYLQEFIDRSLVLICKRSSDGKIRTCRIHSALHSFCAGEAHKESIFCAINTQQHSGLSLDEFASSGRWLSLYTHSFDYYVLFSTNNPRSIFFFDENPEEFGPFKLLRVLAFVPPQFLRELSKNLGDLIFLRYLSITQRFEGLGNIVSANPNLQTLIVSSNESQIGAPTIHLPSKVWDLLQLRHLELGDMYTVDPPCVVKEKLRTLSWVSPTHCGTEVYCSFPNIEKLKIFYKDDLKLSHTQGSSSNPIILGNLEKLKQLERLTILVSVGCTVSLFERSTFPSQLEKLRLSGTNLSERDLTIISMLPELKVLKLENAFLGRVWEVAEGGFPKLRFLLLEDNKVEQFLATEDSFPSLERLLLRFCYCLEKIPNEFAVSLQSIELDSCNPSAVSSAEKLQKDLWNGYRIHINIELKNQGSDTMNHNMLVQKIAGFTMSE